MAYTNSIPDSIKSDLTLPPPPVYCRQMGKFVSYAHSDSCKYAEIASVKAKHSVGLTEELDVGSHPCTDSDYLLTVYMMPFRADLELILRAAEHLDFIRDFDYQMCVSTDAASGPWSRYWQVTYHTPAYRVRLDPYAVRQQILLLEASRRRAIWNGLFNAMGYRTNWMPELG